MTAEPPKEAHSEEKSEADKAEKAEKRKEAAEAVPDEAPKAAKPSKPPAKSEPSTSRSPLSDVLLFGRFDTSEVSVADAGIARYIDTSPVAVPHTGGKHSSRAFGKARMSIVERLINGMMRTEDFTGKKIKSYKAVEDAFVLIHEKTDRNPLQLLVDHSNLRSPARTC